MTNEKLKSNELNERQSQKILVTGAAGFIGFHLCRRLLSEGFTVLGLDNLNDYYSVQLKNDRLKQLQSDHFEFIKCDLNDPEFLKSWQNFQPDIVYHLAAQAGVRYSLTNPEKYAHSNLNGFFQVLEGMRTIGAKHLIYASSSSVYGNSTTAPFQVSARADQPISFYAATKRSNELMAQSYSHLYKLPMTGLRFFTVYGSWGRPDMAYFSFTKSILENRVISLFDPENQQRDFTHVNDIVESMLRLADKAPAYTQESLTAHRLLNIGASHPINLRAFLKCLEETIGQSARLEIKGPQPGDVQCTYADVAELEKLTQSKPKVSLAEGLREFYDWYKSYYSSTDRRDN